MNINNFIKEINEVCRANGLSIERTIDIRSDFGSSINTHVLTLTLNEEVRE